MNRFGSIDADMVKRFNRGEDIQYDYASGIGNAAPIYDEHPYAKHNRNSIARGRSHKIIWPINTRRNG